MKNIKCKYYRICTNLYSQKELKKSCPKINENISTCKLIEEVHNGKISSFALSLIERVSKAPVEEEHFQKVRCPRSTITKVEIKRNCHLKTCPFYSSKLAYNCFLIHHSIFFYDYKKMPGKMLEIGTGLDKVGYNKLVDIGVYLCRMYIILMKYKTMQTRSSLKKRGTLSSTTKLRTLTHFDKFSVCSLCSGVFSSLECPCIADQKLRKARIRFSTEWGKKIKENKENIIGTKNINQLNPQTFGVGYNKHGLNFVRALIGTVQVEGTFLRDLPFGFIFALFHEFFFDRKRKMAENLGLTDAVYKKSLVLWGV